MSKQLRRPILISIVPLLLLGLSSPIVLGQGYPNKPVVLVIPSGPGGTHDLTARVFSSVAIDYLGQPLVIQLKPGGTGAIGSDLVSKAAPDGYTLLMGGPGWSSTLPAVEGRSKGPDDFEAVCLINYNSILVVAHPDAPFKTFKQMMTWTKANPGKLLVGNAGPWLQVDIFWKQLMKQTGITVKIVPYDGGGPQMMAVLGGHVQVGGASPSQYVPYMNTGKLIPLLFLDNKRHPSFPDVPTSIEEGVNIVSRLWRGILAPKNTPRPVIEKLATAFKKMTEDKSVISMIDKYGDDINYLGPEEFTKYWRTEYENYKELGKIYKK